MNFVEENFPQLLKFIQTELDSGVICDRLLQLCVGENRDGMALHGYSVTVTCLLSYWFVNAALIETTEVAVLMTKFLPVPDLL